ncbi:hypothetical protein [Plasticicumulans sp.]|uniref:hypothetical protein n=1 Tax=Plasticicumulans sp. TaxID=2307179 RepID=UPI0039404693
MTDRDWMRAFIAMFLILGWWTWFYRYESIRDTLILDRVRGVVVVADEKLPVVFRLTAVSAAEYLGKPPVLNKSSQATGDGTGAAGLFDDLIPVRH